MPMTSLTRFRPLLLAAVLGLGFAAGWTLRSGDGAAVAQEDAAVLAEAQLTRLGKKAVDAWVNAVASGDAAVIGKVLAPEFQIVRADGTAYGAEAYLQSEFPRFPEPPQIGTLVVTGHGDHLVARYEINSKIMLGDEAELRNAPRLTVFRKGLDGTWLVVAHSNFAALVP